MKYPVIWQWTTDCSGNITSNADIGGKGVMSAFLATAWFTIIVAAVPAGYDLYQWAQRDGNPKPATNSSTLPKTSLHQDHRSTKDQTQIDEPMPPIVAQAQNLLGPLCDLQAITGLSIVIGGFAIHKSISFYHEQLVIQYWNITLNSFWTSRAEFMDVRNEIEELEMKRPSNANQRDICQETHCNCGQTSPNCSQKNAKRNDKRKKLRITARRLLILASCILGVAFQIWVAMREWIAFEQNGDSLSGDQCFNHHDGSNPWPWIVGLLIFCPLLFLMTLRITRHNLIIPYHNLLTNTKKHMQTSISHKYELLKERHSSKLVGITANAQSVANSHHSYQLGWVTLGVESCVYVIFWLVTVWLSVWAYSDVDFRITWWFYLGFCIWSSFDIISIQQLNRSRLADDELGWGFGQVLPLVLLIAVFYNIMDAFVGTREEKKNCKAGDV